MVFSSLVWLCFFLPAVILGYAIVWRLFGKRSTLVPNLFLCIASLLFYGWGSGIQGIRTILLLIAINWVLSYLLRTKRSRAAMITGVVFNCAVLFRYKYPILLLNALGTGLGATIDPAAVLIPLGMSFVIFHCISYLADIYIERELPRVSNELHELLNFSLYILFFPKLIQGPIVRYQEMEQQINKRTFSIDGLFYGCQRFILGLGKKVLLADQLGAAMAQMTSANGMDTPTAWLAILVYSMQLYLDFSGYSDMAIGLAKMFGFSFRENFNFPYLSTSISEFWRRWHISLGTWFREYVYIPLGGSRTGSVYVNLFIVFLLTGIWHGNTAIYLCWGLAHGLFVLAERTKLYQKLRAKIPGASFFGWLYTMLVVGLGWLCFRLPYVSDFFAYLKVLAGFAPAGLTFTWQYYITPKLVTLLLISCTGMFVLSSNKIRKYIHNLGETSVLFCIVKYIALLALFIACFATIVSNGYAPFLYFQF